MLSDVNGSFTFRSLKAGNYTVVIEGGEHFESERETVLVESGSGYLDGERRELFRCPDLRSAGLPQIKVQSDCHENRCPQRRNRGRSETRGISLPSGPGLFGQRQSPTGRFGH